MEMEITRPMGPLMGKLKLSEDLVAYLNESMSSQLKDYSDNLVGKVKEELLFTEEITKRVIDELAPYFAAYHKAHNVKDSDKKLEVNVRSGWYVRQFKNDYNPLHVHSGCTISCVGYLKLPDKMDQEFEEDEKDHHPANGNIEFAYGNSAMSYTQGTVKLKPVVGDFYIFPNGLWHTVYPFRSEGERRSFSMNVIVQRMPEDE